MSFKTQFKIQCLLPATGCRKVLGIMSDIGIGTFFVCYKYRNHDKKNQLLQKVLFFKQQFTEHIKMTVKSINIKNLTH